jgi:hypothetical protein
LLFILSFSVMFDVWVQLWQWLCQISHLGIMKIDVHSWIRHNVFCFDFFWFSLGMISKA